MNSTRKTRYHPSMRRTLAITLLAITLPLHAQQTPSTQNPTPKTQPQVFPGTAWATTTPAAAGWDAARTASVDDYLKEIGVTAYMLIQHGLVVQQGGEVDARSQLHSCRKSFLSALIGIAVARNQIHLEDTLAQLNIDDNPPSLTPTEKTATVHMLLEARSGVYHPSAYETDGMKAKRPERGSHAPGTFWYYNNWDFNTLGGIYEAATHTGIFDALATEIAAPIGMQDFRASDGTYVREDTSRFPAYTMRMSARDFARFAMLYLHHGNWNGKQIVPADWVAASTRPYSDNSSGGYGYLWWTGDSATPSNHPTTPFPPGSFWLEGHLGQFAVVVPSLDLIVITRINSARTKLTVDKGQVSKLVHLVVEAAQPR